MPICPSTIQTASGLASTHGLDIGITLRKKERAVLRECAKRQVDIAANPLEQKKVGLWKRHNSLRGERPVVFCDPENGWNEIIPQDSLECETPLLRVWEMAIRKEIFWGEKMRDDKVIEPVFTVPYSYTDSGWGISEVVEGHPEDGGSYVWQAPIEEYERDFSKLHIPEISVDFDRTNAVFDLARDIFGDILEVRLKGVWWWTLGMTWDFIRLRGITNFLMDFYDHPGYIHRLMDFLKNGTLAKLDFLETNGLLSLNNDGTYVGSGGFGWTDELPSPEFDSRTVKTMDMWGFTESQETVNVDPVMFAEFILPYQLPIQERFGLNCYGCCEPLDSRWEYVRKIPRLRRVSCSPWANIPMMSEYLGNGYILSLKPSPAALATSNPDFGAIRSDLRQAIKTTKHNRVEIIMKDNHTLGHNPDNIVRWVAIAREEIENM